MGFAERRQPALLRQERVRTAATIAGTEGQRFAGEGLLILWAIGQPLALCTSRVSSFGSNLRILLVLGTSRTYNGRVSASTSQCFV